MQINNLIFLIVLDVKDYNLMQIVINKSEQIIIIVTFDFDCEVFVCTLNKNLGNVQNY